MDPRASGCHDDVSFHDLLGDQMRRAPWLLLSIGAHLVLVLLVLLAHRPETAPRELPPLAVALDEVPPVEEEPPVVDPPDVPPDPTHDVPTPEPVAAELHDESASDEPSEETEGVEDQPAELRALDASDLQDAIGLAGGPSGGFAGRRPGRIAAKKGSGQRSQLVVDHGLEWLARHQTAATGQWDADAFMTNGDPKLGPLCDGPGGALNDVGVTGLSLLAFLGAGETHRAGDYRRNVTLGLRWLIDQQDGEGCVGARTATTFAYDHAIATLALCEAYGITRSLLLKEPAERAVAFVGRCQNPYAAWRYGIADGQNDTSVTGWMVMALKSATQAGIAVDGQRLAWAHDFIESMTDLETGRTGYLERGSLPVRESDAITAFPARESESLTAVGVLCRIFAGEDPARSAAIRLGTDLMLEKLPVWDEARGSIDMYYWYYGTLAMHQVGGSAWNDWNRRMQEAVVETQRSDGNFSGSWDPKGPWGQAGGRVYATAMMTLCLEVYYRYGRVFGTR